MEIWKDIIGFEDDYEISNLGSLRSKDRYVKHYKGGLRLYKGSTKNIRVNRYGYCRCNLKKDGVRYDFVIHRLVAEAFLPNPENKPQVNHKDGNKENNRLENLEWSTASENIVHAVKSRLINTKLTDKEAKEVYNSDLSYRKLAKFFGVSNSIVYRIKNNIAYKHLHAS